MHTAGVGKIVWPSFHGTIATPSALVRRAPMKSKSRWWRRDIAISGQADKEERGVAWRTWRQKKKKEKKMEKERKEKKTCESSGARAWSLTGGERRNGESESQSAERELNERTSAGLSRRGKGARKTFLLCVTTSLVARGRKWSRTKSQHDTKPRQREREREGEGERETTEKGGPIERNQKSSRLSALFFLCLGRWTINMAQ